MSKIALALLASHMLVGLHLAAAKVYGNVKTVHVINSCHLDIGFADSSAGIVERYFSEHIPNAVKVGRELREGNFSHYTDNKLNFMFQSWILSFYFDCPPGMGFSCPSAADVAAAKQGIANGDITWHAFPHNAQLEIASPSLLRAGLELTHDLDAMFDQPKKMTLSQRDVPGMSRSLVPLLNASGVRAISIGANGGSTPPEVPPCFVWHDAVSETSLYGLFTWPGYGALPIESTQMPCIVGDHALVYNWNGDNAGPFSASQYDAAYKTIAESFPNAQISAGIFDDFLPYLEAGRDALPQLDVEIGDSWLYGVPSDAAKVSWIARFNKLWDPSVAPKNATRFVLKNLEHTWGRDVKSNLKDNDDWLNKDFWRARASGSNASQFQILEQSWWEQREWGVIYSLVELGKAAAAGDPGAKAMQSAIMEDYRATIVVDGKPFARSGFVRIDRIEDPISIGGYQIAFDPKGSISQLRDRSGRMWASHSKVLGRIVYRTYSQNDVAKFMASYCKENASWVQHDYGKPNLPASVVGKEWETVLQSVHKNGNTLLVELSFDPSASREYGAPKQIWVNITAVEDEMYVTLTMVNKTTTRLPESLFYQFIPLDVALPSHQILKQGGTWMHVGTVDGGAPNLVGGTAFRAAKTSGGGTLTVTAQDQVILSVGNPYGYPVPHVAPDVKNGGIGFCICDNLWGTNYGKCHSFYHACGL